MARRIAFIALLAGISLTPPCPAPACSLCQPGSARTLRQDAARAHFVVYGSLFNARITGKADSLFVSGATDFRIEQVLKSDALIEGKKVIEIPRYVPMDDQTPKCLVFCEVYKDKDGVSRLEPINCVQVKSAAVLDYVKGILSLNAKDGTKSLLYYFDYLEHADAFLATDAFLEFALAGDQEIGQVAGKLAADKLRRWVKDPETPVSRLGLYAFLLGTCGAEKDAEILRGMLSYYTARTVSALDGLLAGYIQLQPKAGWDLVCRLLRDEKLPFLDRYTVMRVMRLYHGWQPQESRAQVVKALAAALPQSDLTDLAVEDLRRWQVWELTGEILSLYGKKKYDAPIQRRAILRYALACPRPEAVRFAAAARRQSPDEVQEVEESLGYER